MQYVCMFNSSSTTRSKNSVSQTDRPSDRPINRPTNQPTNNKRNGKAWQKRTNHNKIEECMHVVVKNANIDTSSNSSSISRSISSSSSRHSGNNNNKNNGCKSQHNKEKNKIFCSFFFRCFSLLLILIFIRTRWEPCRRISVLMTGGGGYSHDDDGSNDSIMLLQPFIHPNGEHVCFAHFLF